MDKRILFYVQNFPHLVLWLATITSSEATYQTAPEVVFLSEVRFSPDLEVIKLEYSLKIKIKRNDWLLAHACPQAASHRALSLRMN